MSASQARALADELTIQVSAYLRRDQPGNALALSTPQGLPCFPIETWNQLTVGVPWEAYSHAYGVCGDRFITNKAQAICSAPAQLDQIISEQAAGSSLWGGSLLVALGNVLEEVEKKLVVWSPYWRKDGVRSLLAVAGRQSYVGINVTVFSQPKCRMKIADQDGLTFFIDTLRAAGAQVDVLAPNEYEGSTPILHAKLIIADGIRAYVGSANFTKSGLEKGIEAGVLLEGEAAKAFSSWSSAIAGACNPW